VFVRRGFYLYKDADRVTNSPLPLPDSLPSMQDLSLVKDGVGIPEPTAVNATWLRYVPRYLRLRLHGRYGLQKAVANSGWLLCDRLFRLGLGLFVGVWIARFLGPEQFGIWNFALAFTAIFGSVSTLGLDAILVRELVKQPDRKYELIGSAFVLRAIGAVVALVLAVVLIGMMRPGDIRARGLVLIAALGFVFQSVNVIDLYFQAKVQARSTIIAANAAFLIVTAAKLWLLIVSANLFAFAWVALSEFALSALFLVVAYRLNAQRVRLWRFDRRTARHLAQGGLPLVLGGLAIMIYMRIDQVMIGQFLGAAEVGIFSAAVRISEIWYFIPIAIMSSLFPGIVAHREAGSADLHQRLQRLFAVMVWASILVAVVMSLSSDVIVRVLYGAKYTRAGGVLAIHAWALVFVSLGAASGSYLTVGGLQRYYFYRAVCGCLANILLNLYLIPRYGVQGAAIATVASFGISVFSIGLFGKGRPIFAMLIKSFDPTQTYVRYRR
jgi:O-antigen/teichoic acid export membrane protein